MTTVKQALDCVCSYSEFYTNIRMLQSLLFNNLLSERYLRIGKIIKCYYDDSMVNYQNVVLKSVTTAIHISWEICLTTTDHSNTNLHLVVGFLSRKVWRCIKMVMQDWSSDYTHSKHITSQIIDVPFNRMKFRLWNCIVAGVMVSESESAPGWRRVQIAMAIAAAPQPLRLSVLDPNYGDR